MTAKVHIVGVLNVTPDSFSDGGRYLAPEAAIHHANLLLSSGADLVDIGADSTRPGSVCIGDEEEWSRLEPVLNGVSDITKVSIDTHSMPTARRAIKAGVRMINDISGGSQEMFELVADTGVKLVIMYSRCPSPHVFKYEESENIFEDIRNFFDKKIDAAEQTGVALSQLIFDPGMGSFISKNPLISIELLHQFECFASYERLYLGVSRKGFLKTQFLQNESVTTEALDTISFMKAAEVIQKLPESIELYVRSHNIEQLLELRHAKSISVGQ